MRAQGSIMIKTLDLLPLRDAVRSYAMTPLQFEPLEISSRSGIL
jgi:hypothetical protein